MDVEAIYQTDRLDFILPNLEYLNDYLELVNNPEIYIYVTLDHTDYTYEDEIGWVNRHQEGDQFTLIDRETGHFVGNCGFNEIGNGTCEIGILLNPDYHNNRYGREAIRGLIDIAFNRLNLNEVNLIAFDYNTRGLRCYEACGFETYNIVPLNETYNGNLVNDVYMRILR